MLKAFSTEKNRLKMSNKKLIWGQFNIRKVNVAFTLMLKVKEQFWKLPEGRITPRFMPLERRKFSSCLLNGNLQSFVGYSTDAVDVVAHENYGSFGSFLSVDEGGEGCWHLLQLIECWSLTVAFNICITLVPCDCLNFTMFFADQTVMVVALNEWLVRKGKILALSVIFLSKFSRCCVQIKASFTVSVSIYLRGTASTCWVAGSEVNSVQPH